MKVMKIISLFTLLSLFFGRPGAKPEKTEAEKIAEAYAACITESVVFAENDDYAPDGDYIGIKAITVDGFTVDGEKTKFFAYVAYPEDADENTPGVVLVHGGGGHSYLPWVKQWIDRGYAVIAPDVTGYFPTEKGAGDSETDTRWTRTPSAFLDGGKPIPDNDGMAHSSESAEKQWMYHAVGAVIRSFSLLADSGKVAPDKIGAVGISWGAVIVTEYIGFDPRPAFAVPIYGSAYLSDSLAYMGATFSEPATKELWSAEDRLDGVKCPVLWLSSDLDGNFSPNSNSLSYLKTAKTDGTRLSIVKGLAHSHSAAWERKEPLVFADSIVNGGEEMPLFVTLPTGDSVECEVRGGTTARLYYLTENPTYSLKDEDDPLSTMPDYEWKKTEVKMADGKLVGEIPENAVVYYISVTESGCTVSSPLTKR